MPVVCHESMDKKRRTATIKGGTQDAAMVTTDVDIPKWAAIRPHFNGGFNVKRKARLSLQSGFRDPVGIRTPNLRIRSAMLYPVELQGRVN